MTVTPAPIAGKRRAKFWVVGGLVAIAVPALVVWGLGRPSATSFYVTVSEALRRAPGSASRDYRVNGRVVAGSIRRRGLDTTFSISDGTDSMPVATDQPLP